MMSIRRARPADALMIGVVHAAVWQSAYPGILPDSYLASLSPLRLGGFYQRAILDRREAHAVFVAVAGIEDRPDTEGGIAPRVVGFASGGRARRTGLADGEIETLYLLEDYRERGIGRRLMRAMAAHLRAVGCGSALVWVLKENPSRWFYERLGGKIVAQDRIRVGGQQVEQVAFAWESIESLLSATLPVQER